MNDEDDDNQKRKLVGYGHPPKQHQWKKGQSGNPKGRRKKEQPDNRIATLLSQIDNEIVEVGGLKITRREVELRQLSTKAMKGDLSASRMLAKMRRELGMMTPGHKRQTAVLVVPMAASPEEWAQNVAEAQRKYREEQNYSDYD